MLVHSHPYTGMIIRSTLPYKNSVIIVSSQLGLREYTIPAKSLLVQGAFIRFTLQERRGKYTLKSSELIALPHLWVMNDILFLHRVLELIVFFVPYGSGIQGLLEHCMLLFEKPEHEDLDWYKKLFICRLFSLLGVCPENAELYNKNFLCLISAPIDIMLNVQRAVLFDTIDIWMRGCIQSHPRSHEIKTYCL